MIYAINLNAVLPVRATPSEASEMVTQLLFGEYCTVLDEEKLFAKIENRIDGYMGWVDCKMLTEITALEFETLQSRPVFRTCVPVADVFCLNDKSIYKLSLGSLLPNYDADSNHFGLGDLSFQIHPSFVSHVSTTNSEGIVPTALSMLNTPYLWGGKNIMGIDCSGLVQVVFSINGFFLPRDASQQCLLGNYILFEDARAGDLFFFEKEGKITHVGIYWGNSKILHASGKVRVDMVDTKGIYRVENSEYTHFISQIRRVHEK